MLSRWQASPRALCPRVTVSQCRAVSTCHGVAVPRCVHVSHCRVHVAGSQARGSATPRGRTRCPPPPPTARPRVTPRHSRVTPPPSTCQVRTPLSPIDLSRYVGGGGPKSPDGPGRPSGGAPPSNYELFAVCDHSGSLSCGFVSSPRTCILRRTPTYRALPRTYSGLTAIAYSAQALHGVRAAPHRPQMVPGRPPRAYHALTP